MSAPRKPARWRAAVVGVDVVGEAVDVLGVAVVPLQRDLDADAVALARRSRSASRWSVSLFRFRCSTKEAMPPSYWKRCFLPSRSSSRVIRMPRFRNESSRRRCESVSKLKVVVSKICGSGLKVTFVPRRSVTPVCSSRVCGHAARVALAVDLARRARSRRSSALGERVHARDADAVEAARDLVGLLVELAARVELGQHDLGRRRARTGVRARRGCRGRCRSR